MKRHAGKSDALLYRFLGLYDAPHEKQMENAIDAVWRNLQDSAARHAKSTPRLEPNAPKGFGFWRAAIAGFALAMPVVAAVLAVVAGWDIVPKTSTHSNAGMVRVSMEQIENHRIFDSDGPTGTALVLPDGSRVEMHVQTEVSFERAADGLRIRLNKGNILVTAAKQRNGHLYVQTRDVGVSVVGTVFLVNAEPQGSRVAVIEGEVHVQKGATTERLFPGEQVASNPGMPARSVVEEISWSRNAQEHFAMLQQSAVPPAAPAAEPADRFEVASIRPSEFPNGPGARGGGGRLSATLSPPCLSANAYAIAGLQLQLNPGRLVLKYLPLHTLVALAYGHECPAPETLTGGADWVKTDIFDVEATIPVGTPAYTKDQFLSGNAPRLQRMLQNLLADRFKLVMKREVKEMQVYNLVVAQPGKLKSSADQTPDQPLPPPVPGGLLRGGRPPAPGIPIGTAPISRLAANVQSIMRRPVIDKTGLTGLYDMWLEFPEVPLPTPPADGTPPSDSAARIEETQAKIRDLLPSKLESTLGLRLEAAKAPTEVLVIVSAERPSPN